MSSSNLRRLLLLVLSLVAAGCDLSDQYPVDPGGTLERVRGGTLRAGVIHAPPWVIADGVEPAGREAELVRHLAAEFGADLQWQRGAPDQLLALLEEQELDVLIAGFEERSTATRNVGTTRPYAKIHWWVVAGNATAATSIEGERIAVRHGKAAVLVKEAGGIPVHADSVPGEPELQAIPFIGSGEVLPRHPLREIGTSEHVLAVPPGENAWVVAIDRSLRRFQKEDRVPAAPEEAVP